VQRDLRKAEHIDLEVVPTNSHERNCLTSWKLVKARRPRAIFSDLRRQDAACSAPSWRRSTAADIAPAIEEWPPRPPTPPAGMSRRRYWRDHQGAVKPNPAANPVMKKTAGRRASAFNVT